MGLVYDYTPDTVPQPNTHLATWVLAPGGSCSKAGLLWVSPHLGPERSAWLTNAGCAPLGICPWLLHQVDVGFDSMAAMPEGL